MKKTTRKTAAPAPASFEIPAGYTLQTTVEHAVARLVLTAAPLAKTGGWRIDLEYTPAPCRSEGGNQ